MLICLDFDGVIVDSLHHHVHLAQVAQQKLGEGRRPDETDFHEISSLTYQGFALRLGIPKERWEDWETIHMTLVESDGQVSDVFPEMPAILHALSRTHSLAVVTANIEEIVRETLERAGASDTVSLILDAYHPGSKADRIEEAMQKCGVEPADTFMVGDSRSDISEGRKAGVNTVAVGWGFQHREVLEIERPDYFVQTPADLLALFRPAE